MEKFNSKKFLEVAKTKGLSVNNIERVTELGVTYVEFSNENLSHIKVSNKMFNNKNNCINIYYGESSKDGYWFDGLLDYSDFVDKLATYCK